MNMVSIYKSKPLHLPGKPAFKKKLSLVNDWDELPIFYITL
jgi:hypothetical protein